MSIIDLSSNSVVTGCPNASSHIPFESSYTAPCIIMLHLDILVRNPSSLGGSSGKLDARRNVTFMEECPVKIPRFSKYHPSRFHRCNAVVLRFRTSCPPLSTGEIAETIHFLECCVRSYSYWITWMGCQYCWRRWAIVQDCQYE